MAEVGDRPQKGDEDGDDLEVHEHDAERPKTHGVLGVGESGSEELDENIVAVRDIVERMAVEESSGSVFTPMEGSIDGVEGPSSADIILDGFTGFEVGGKTLEQWIAIAEEFYDKEAIPHSEALGSLQSILKSAYPEMEDSELDWKEVAKELPREIFYSSADKTFGTARSRSIQIVKETLATRWEAGNRDPNSPWHFAHGKRGFPTEKGAQAPRLLLCQHLAAFNLDDDLMKRNQQYQMLFLAVCSEKLRELEARKCAHGAESEEAIATERELASLHRIASAYAQISCLYSIKLKKSEKGEDFQGESIMKELPEDKGGFKIPATATRFFEGNGDKECVDKYIIANLSLIFPDKGSGKGFADKENGQMRLMTNEDMVFMNLMVLAQEYGLYEKYRDIFKAVFYYRRFQNVRAFQWDPKKLTLDNDPARVSLKSLFEGYHNQHHKAPEVLSFGFGDGMLEEFLLSRKAPDGTALVKRVTGAEVDSDRDFNEGSTATESADGRMAKLTFGVRDKIIKREGPWNYSEDPTFREEMMLHLPDADIVLATDSLHETSAPTQYAISLWEKVRRGGYLYVTDPVHSVALDDVTHEASHPYDKTKWQDSMMSLEIYYNLIDWLTSVEGAFNSPEDSERISSGMFAGNNDTYWRECVVFEKPADPTSHIAYRVPDEGDLWDKIVADDSQIFEMWPFSLVKAEQRNRVLEMLVDKMKQRSDVKNRQSLVLDSNGSPDIKFRDLKKMLIKLLVSEEEVRDVGGDPEYAYRIRVAGRVPYPKVGTMIQVTAGGKRPDLIFQNHLAGEVRALADLVLESARLELPLGSTW